MVLPPTTQEEQLMLMRKKESENSVANAVPKDHLRRFMEMDDAKEDLGSYQDKVWVVMLTLRNAKSCFGNNSLRLLQSRLRKVLEKGMIGFQKLLSQLEAIGAGVFAMTYPSRSRSSTRKQGQKAKSGWKNALQSFKGSKEEKQGRKQVEDDIDDSLYEYGKYRPQPQSPSPTVSNTSSIIFSICPSNDSDGELGTVSGASSTHYSTCQSNDSDGELGTVSDHSVNDDPVSTQKTQPKVPTPTQTVDPSCAQHVKTPRQPIRTPMTPSPIPSYKRHNWNQRMKRKLGAGYSFERKPCFVCGSLSHLIKNCDYYEKKMAREAALKSKRVVHTNDRQATPAWNNTNRVNKANQFTPRPVNVRPNLSTASNTIKTGRVNVNTGHGNVNSGSVHVNAGTQVKSVASRFNTGKQHVNSGSMRVNSVTQFKSGASRINTGNKHINTARVNRPVSNKTSPKPSQVKFNSQNKCFSKQSSPVNRPFSRNTAYKSNIYAVKGKMGTAVKTSAGCVWRKTTPLSNTNSGPTPDSNVHDHPLKHMEHRGIFDSGCSGHMTGNRAHLEDYQELSKVGSVTFGGSKGSISGKAEILKKFDLVNVKAAITPMETKLPLTKDEEAFDVDVHLKNWISKQNERELGAGYSFERKPCFVCGSLSHLIKDCDYYETKMAREAAFKSTRVVHANISKQHSLDNSNRVYKSKSFTPRPVQLIQH
ncbi:hypothetical protein Tco_0404363 [Tanacetum coccineum]